MTQIGFDKHFNGKLILNGIDLFEDEAALSKLLKLDSDSHLWVGFVMLMGLGVRLSGFHEVADEGGLSPYLSVGAMTQSAPGSLRSSPIHRPKG